MRIPAIRLFLLALLPQLLYSQPAANQLLEDLKFTEVVRGVAGVTALTHAGDRSGRLFISEQIGRVMIYDGESLVEEPYLDIRDRVRAGGERGLLSVAFHPDYSLNGYLFVNYTDLDSNTVVSRFQVTEDPNVADPSSEVIYFAADQPRRNHNGGQIQFGPDGYLYIGMGDGGGAGDPPNLAQDLTSVLGKMLRVDIDQGAPAVAPVSNPFTGRSGVPPEIWAYGLRNPWRFSFDRLTGELFIGDVGQNRVEEISHQPADSSGGENYGWRLMEGSQCFRPATGCNNGSLVLPILEYENSGGNCGGSVTGGYRYRGAAYPQFEGVYFYADYCTGDFYGAVLEDGAWAALGPLPTALSIRTFGEDEVGEIYFADPSVVYRIEAIRPAPRISDGGVVNAASLELGRGLVPGSLATAFGIGLAEGAAAATGSTLPVDLGGGRIVFNDSVLAPQVLASPGQRNFQVPWELAGLRSARLSVTVGKYASPAVDVPIARFNPGIFTLDTSGQAVALATDGMVVSGRGLSVFGYRLARHGDLLKVLATGLGPVEHPQISGVPDGGNPPAVTMERVEVRLGGRPMPLEFAGLDPDLAGLYQVQFWVADSAPAGAAVPLVLTVAGADSNTAFLAIEEPAATP